MTIVPPEVSVVMPVRNVEPTVDVALRSIVFQSFEDWELLAVDDGSTDETVSHLHGWAARDARIRVYVGGRPAGLPTRLNQAVDLAAGALIARMDGDDVSYPHRLATQVAYLREHLDVDLVATGMMVFGSDGAPRGPRRLPSGAHEIVTGHVFRGIPMPHPTWMGRRAWFMRNRYDMHARGCEDQELLLRAEASSRYANLPDVLLGYREDRIKLRRSIEARMHYSAFLLRYGARHSRLLPSLVASAAQLAKGARDVAAVGMRREDLVLARRNRCPSPAETAMWLATWAALTAQ